MVMTKTVEKEIIRRVRVAIVSAARAHKLPDDVAMAAIEAVRDYGAAEIERLRGAIRAIQQATIDGAVCDDVAWFSPIETLHDFCDVTLHGSKN